MGIYTNYPDSIYDNGAGGGGGGGIADAIQGAAENMPLALAKEALNVYLNDGGWNVAVGFLVLPSVDIDITDGVTLEYRVLQGGTDASAKYRFALYEMDDNTEFDNENVYNLVALGSVNNPAGVYGTCRESLQVVANVDKLSAAKKYAVVMLTDSSNFWTYTGVILGGVTHSGFDNFPHLSGHIIDPPSVDASADDSTLQSVKIGAWTVDKIPYFRIVSGSLTNRKM